MKTSTRFVQPVSPWKSGSEGRVDNVFYWILYWRAADVGPQPMPIKPIFFLGEGNYVLFLLFHLRLDIKNTPHQTFHSGRVNNCVWVKLFQECFKDKNLWKEFRAPGMYLSFPCLGFPPLLLALPQMELSRPSETIDKSPLMAMRFQGGNERYPFEWRSGRTTGDRVI